MTSLQRLLAEIAGCVFLIAALTGWWQWHDHTERDVGATACVQHTTESKAVAVADNIKTGRDEVEILKQAVAVYDKQVADLNDSNVGLSKRLHDLQVRAEPVQHPRAAAGATCPDRSISPGESEAADRLGRILADVAPVLDACDADHAKLAAVTSDYEGIRKSIIEDEQKRAPLPPPPPP